MENGEQEDPHSNGLFAKPHPSPRKPLSPQYMDRIYPQGNIRMSESLTNITDSTGTPFNWLAYRRSRKCLFRISIAVIIVIYYYYRKVW